MEKVTGYYVPYFKEEDYGCSVNLIHVHLDQVLDSIKKEQFSVKETKQVTDFTTPTFDVVVKSFNRQVTDVYYEDNRGNKVETPTKNIAIEMMISPSDGSPFLFSMKTLFNTYSDPYELDIQATNLTVDGKEVELTVTKTYDKYESKADVFKLDHFKATNGQEYNYAYYQPEKESSTLVVWLHGVGEGGIDHTDPYVTLLANKVTALVSTEFQNTLGGAHVLVPQCPTFWMDRTGKGLVDGRIAEADGTSFYTDSLHECINDYRQKHSIKKVVICGCSNGGYMTLLFALKYKDEYDVYVPICEAIPDKYIRDEQLEGIKDLPLYFIYSKDDTTVVPSIHEEPTIKRLQAMKASNLHSFVSDVVIDTTGKFNDENDNPVQYDGHWSWIYFFNNEASKSNQPTIWQWIKDQLD